MRGATSGRHGFVVLVQISIHAPHAGRDAIYRLLLPEGLSISIHAPRAGRDHDHNGGGRPTAEFQSTRPVRGATGSGRGSHRPVDRFQSTRPVRGATSWPPGTRTRERISIHAPRAGRDEAQEKGPPMPQISIHAPRAGRDWYHPLKGGDCHDHFNPRAPCGARLSDLLHQNSATNYFNPRAPCGARPKSSLSSSTSR